MIWNSFRCAVWVMLAFLLVSCQFMPTQTGNQKPIAADVRPAFGTKADNSGQSQTLMAPGQLLFPSQVTLQTFALINKPDAKGKFWWVRFVVAKELYPKPAQTEISGDDEDDDPDERAEEKSEDADHDDRPATHRIWIPENGNFKVNLVAGNRFQVMDSDARDQEATVQVPTALLSTYLRLEGPKSKESKKNKRAIERKLTLAEALYNVNQTVSRIGPEREGKRDRDEQKQPWLKLGNRPFPVPVSWSSPEGQKYVLNFNNQGVQRFVTRWYRAQTGAQPDYPVGLNEIGPAGGTVELPGVARLEVPAGAIVTPTVIRMSQAMDALSEEKVCEFVGTIHEHCYLGYIYVTPIVKLEPLNFRPAMPVKLSLAHFPEAYNYGGMSLESAITDDPAGGFDRTSQDVMFPPEITSIYQTLEVEWPITVKRFGYICKQALAYAKRSQEQGFKAQQVSAPSPKPTACPSVADEPSSAGNFAIRDKDAEIPGLSCRKLDPDVIKRAGDYLEASYAYYISQGLKVPQRWDPVKKVSSTTSPIQIELGTRLVSDDGVEVKPDERAFTRPKYSGTDKTPAELRQYQGTTIQLNTTKCKWTGDTTESCELDVPGSYNRLLNAITSAHELFHVFQYDYVPNLAQTFHADETYFREGSASYMGFLTALAKRSSMGFSDDDFKFPALNDTQYVREHIQELNGVAHSPLRTAQYDGNIFWTNVAKAYGNPKVIVSTLQAFGALAKDVNLPALRINQALENVLEASPLNSSFTKAYFGFTEDAFFKRNLSLFPPQYPRLLPMNSVPFSLAVIPYQGSQSDAPVTSVGLDNLSSSYLRVQPTSEKGKLHICLEGLEPSTFDAGGSFNSKDYVFVQAIGIEKDDGSPLTEEFDPAQNVNDLPVVKSRAVQTNTVFQPVSLNSCIDISDFGSNATYKSVAVAVSNGNWRTKASTPISVSLKVFVDPAPPGPPPLTCNPDTVPVIGFFPSDPREGGIFSLDFSFICPNYDYNYVMVLSVDGRIDRLGLGTNFYGNNEMSTFDYLTNYSGIFRKNNLETTGSGSAYIEAIHTKFPFEVRKSAPVSFTVHPGLFG